jgi:hypothetical protein
MGKRVLKVHLLENGLTDKNNDFRAIPVPEGPTRTDDDVADAIVAQGTEFNRNTIKDILARANEAVSDFISSGYSYQNDNFHFSPAVRGAWSGRTAVFDPDIHHIAVNVRMTASMRETMNDVSVVVLGERHETSAIGRVINLATGLDDDTMIPGEYVMIEGKHLRIAPEGDPAVGVFFVPLVRGGAPVPVTHRLHINSPGKLEAKVPESLPFGDYTLRIVTRSTSVADKFLNEARVIEYANPLVAGAAGSGGGGGGGAPGGGIG